MRAFAHLLDRLAFTRSRNAKLTLVSDFLRHTPDPERGWALAALTGDLVFREAKPSAIRAAVEARMDAASPWPGRSITSAISPRRWRWSGRRRAGPTGSPSLSEVVEALAEPRGGRSPGLIEGWLDALSVDAAARALLKLVTGSLRVGLSARLARRAAAAA